MNMIDKYERDTQISQSANGLSYDGKAKSKKPSKFTKYIEGGNMRVSRGWPPIKYGSVHIAMAGQDDSISCSGTSECILNNNRGYLCKKHRSIMKSEIAEDSK